MNRYSKQRRVKKTAQTTDVRPASKPDRKVVLATTPASADDTTPISAKTPKHRPKKSKSAYKTGGEGSSRTSDNNDACGNPPSPISLASTAKKHAKPATGPLPTNPPLDPQKAIDELKPEQTVKISNSRRVKVGAFRDDSGNRYIWFAQGKRRFVTPYSDWHGSSADASVTLRHHGLILIGEVGAIRDAVVKLKRFPLVPVVTQLGWSEHGFAFSDGRVIVATGKAEPVRSFAPVGGIWGQAGTLEDWVNNLAAPLAGHQFAAFCMMVMFAPPLLEFLNRTDNFGFEICGGAGQGKTTLLMLMASAAGPAIGSGEAMYWRALNMTPNALETKMSSYVDLPCLLDEAGLLGGSGKADTRALIMSELAFRLSAGVPKQRHGEAAGSVWRLIYVLSTNVPLSSLFAAQGAQDQAIADRLLSLLLNDRPHGIFDRCPPSYASTGAFADALKQAAADNYGHALPAFLQYIVNYRDREPERLRRVINRSIEKFVVHSGANRNDGSAKRVAEAFGLIYAAGLLAIEARVLPATYKPSQAALTAYRLHRAHGRPASSFADRLLNVLHHPATINLAKTKIGALSDSQRSACPAFIYTGKSGQRELAVPVQHIDTVFPGWKGMNKLPEVQMRLKPSSERLTRDRPVGRNGATAACYVFNIQDLHG